MFNDVYRNKTILVTGNTGFKGSWLTLWLLSLGARVVGVSRDIPTTPSAFECMTLGDRIEHHTGDVTHLPTIREIVHNTGPDIIFHLAAQPITGKGYSDPLDTINTNVLGSANILEVSRKAGKRCAVVMITSDKCYENVEWIWGYRENDRLGGKDPYSASKACAELVIYAFYHSFLSDESCTVKVASTRAGNVIGGGDWAPNRIVPDTIRAWAEQRPVVIRNPNSTRPWQHVLEPLSGYLLLGENLLNGDSENGQAFNFGPAGNEVHTVSQVLCSMAAHWRFGSTHPPYTVAQEPQFHEAGLLKLNCDKAYRRLGWSPSLTFASAIKMTTEWYYNYYHGSGENMYEYSQQQLNDYFELARNAGAQWTI